MANFSQLSLQKALYENLTANAALSGLVQGIYDRVPQATAYPYITIGDSTVYDWSTSSSSGLEQVVRLHVWSREGGRKQASAIMEQIYQCLHMADLNVDGFVLVMMRFISSMIELENDGWTYRGIMQFHALLQAND